MVLLLTPPFLPGQPGESAPGGGPPWEVTIYCDDGYPPYSYSEKGQPRGIYTEIVRAVTERMPSYVITIEPVPWRRGVLYMETGEGFALFPPYERPRERPFMDYSLKMLDEELILLVRAESLFTRDSSWPEDFRGTVLGTNDGFMALEPWRDRGIFTIDQSRNTRSGILKLAQQRIDGYANDRLSIQAAIAEIEACGIPLPEFREGPLLGSEAGHLGITREGGDRYVFKEDFVSTFGSILEEMRASGEIRQIAENYLDQSPGILPP